MPNGSDKPLGGDSPADVVDERRPDYGKLADEMTNVSVRMAHLIGRFDTFSAVQTGVLKQAAEDRQRLFDRLDNLHANGCSKAVGHELLARSLDGRVRHVEQAGAKMAGAVALAIVVTAPITAVLVTIISEYMSRKLQ